MEQLHCKAGEQTETLSWHEALTMLIVSIMGEDLAALSRALSIAAWEHKFKHIQSMKNRHTLPLGFAAKVKNIFKNNVEGFLLCYTKLRSWCCLCGRTGFIPSLAHWVKDPALLQRWRRRLHLWHGNFHMPRGSQKKKKNLNNNSRSLFSHSPGGHKSNVNFTVSRSVLPLMAQGGLSLASSCFWQPRSYSLVCGWSLPSLPPFIIWASLGICAKSISHGLYFIRILVMTQGPPQIIEVHLISTSFPFSK